MNAPSPASETTIGTATLAFEADHACWGACVGSVRHEAMMRGLEVGFVDRAGLLVSLPISGPSAVLEPFMRRIETCFGGALRKGS